MRCGRYIYRRCDVPCGIVWQLKTILKHLPILVCDKRCSRAQNRRGIELFALLLAGCHLIGMVRMCGWSSVMHRMVRKMGTTLCEHDSRASTTLSENMLPCDANFPTNEPDAETMERQAKNICAHTKRVHRFCPFRCWLFFASLVCLAHTNYFLDSDRIWTLFAERYKRIGVVRAPNTHAPQWVLRLQRNPVTSTLTRLSSHLFRAMMVEQQMVPYVFPKIWSEPCVGNGRTNEWEATILEFFLVARYTWEMAEFPSRQRN